MTVIGINTSYVLQYFRGDIILVPFPFTDLTGSKVRPAIILSDHRVHYSGDMIIAQVTTQELKGSFYVTISNEDVETPFKDPVRQQYIYCKKLATIETRIVHKKITRIKLDSKMEEILSTVRSIFSKS